MALRLETHRPQLTVLDWGGGNTDQQIVALALHQSRPAEIEHEAIGRAALALPQSKQLRCRQVERERITRSLQAYAEVAQPCADLKGDLIVDAALSKAAQRCFLPVPLELVARSSGAAQNPQP